MHCPACKATIERALRGVAGIDDVQADYARGTLTASWNSDVLSEEKLSSILSDLGYTISRAPVNRHRAAIQAMCACAILIALVVLTTLTPLAQWLNAFPTAKAGMSLGALFIVGLFTSLHCVAMCGGIGISQTAQAARRGHRVSRSAMLYNLGRVISYTATGAIVGVLGTVLTISTPVKAAIQIVAAAFMLIMALRLIDGFGWLRRINLPRLHISLPRGQHSALVVGLLNGLMPCGPLQSMQLFALSAGGWLMGALSMLVSNMLFSQGVWTPWQMFSMGIIGFLAGVLFRKGLLRRTLGSMCTFGAFCAIVIYGGIMNPASVLMWAGAESLTWKTLLTYYVTGFPVDCVHAAATVFFLWVAAEPMLEKLDRIKEKYGLLT